MHLMHLMADVQVGAYINLWKLLPVLILLLIWARLLTWMDKDAIDAHLPRQILNSIEIAILILGLLVFLFIPLGSYLVGLAVFVFAFVLGLAIYLGLRHQKVGLGDLSKQFNAWIKGIGKGKEKEVKVAEGAVGLINKAGSVIEPPDAESPEAAGYDAVQKLMADPLRRHAEQINLIPQEGAAAVQFTADGVPYSGTTMSRDEATASVQYLKRLAGLDLNELRKPQTGKMKITYGGKKHDTEIVTAGSTAGESVSIGIDVKSRHNLKLEELGMTDEQFTQMIDVIHDSTGIVLLSAPKGQGLNSLVYAVLRRHDAFLSHIQTIERDAPADIEGIKQNPLPPNASGSEEAKLADWVCSQEPVVVAVNEVQDPRTVASLLKFAATGRRVYVGLRAKSTFDALEQWRKLCGDDTAAMKDLNFIVSGRVVRKLCMACKVGYTADPETLRRLNMSPDKVGKLFQARTQPLRDPKGNPLVCEFCQDMHFVGRVGVYETFIVDDEVKRVIVSGGTINQLKAIFRKQRQKYLQEAALARVELGDTSVQEVLRVLGSGGSSSSGSSSGKSPSAGGPTAAPRKPSSGPRPSARPK
jgi:type II secretory ATPase GspE/PulE/Tfp pilus assembly ATPase PilB-like protein